MVYLCQLRISLINATPLWNFLLFVTPRRDNLKANILKTWMAYIRCFKGVLDPLMPIKIERPDWAQIQSYKVLFY